MPTVPKGQQYPPSGQPYQHQHQHQQCEPSASVVSPSEYGYHVLSGAPSPHDQIQMALAIAEEPTLKALLLNCTPPLAQAHRMGSIHSTVGIPTTGKKTIDSIIRFEEIHCVLLDDPVQTDPRQAESSLDPSCRRLKQNLTRYESELQTLGQSVSLAQAIALLSHAGFSPEQVDNILTLPHEAWHKSWWLMPDAAGALSLPFLRMMRTLHYVDGSLTLQYKDYFSQDKPVCFKSRDRQVVVEIKPQLESFSKTLAKINYCREQSHTQHALLICDRLSDLEAEGFISQGISLYSTQPLVRPMQANCLHCQSHCPLRGQANAPVRVCRQFSLEAAAPL